MPTDTSTGLDKIDAPWENEPDREIFSAHGFTCLVNRAVFRDELGNRDARFGGGHLCGYVAVPKGHPWYKKTDRDLDVRVHGGVTYTSHCSGDICHETGESLPDDVWWIGFDCAHHMDVMPFTERLLDDLSPDLKAKREAMWGGIAEIMRPTYKTFGYVKAQTIELAAQAHAAAK